MKRSLRRSNFFYSVFLPIFLIGFLIVSGFFSYIYRETYTTIHNNLIQEKKNYASFVKSHLEQQVRTIEYSFTAYSASDSFKEVIDQSLTYKNYDLVRQVSSELSYIESIGAGQTNYSLISLKKGWQISGGSLYQLTAEEIADYEETVNQTDSYLTWVPKKSGVQMIVSLPFFEQKRNALGLAEITEKSLDELASSKDDFFYLENSEGKLLYSEGKTKTLPQEVKAKLKTVTEKQGQFQADNGDIYLYTRSGYNSWLYVTCLPIKTLNAALRSVRIGLLILSLLMLALIAVVAYMIADHSAKPIREIRHRLTGDPAKPHYKKLEIKEILSGIETIVSENEMLSTTIKTQKPALETLFILDLFRHQTIEAEIPAKLQQFGYPDMTNKAFLTALLQIDDLGARGPEEKEALLVTIAKLVEEIVPAESRLYPVIMDADTQATIFVFDKQLDKKGHQVLEYCQQVQEAIKNYLQVEASFGISDHYELLSESYKAVQTAQEALHFRINLGKSSIIFYEEIVSQLDETTIVRYPRQENELVDAIRGGNKELVDELFPQVIDEIFSENNNPISIEMALLSLSNNIIQLGQLLGADIELFHNNRSIYYKVLQSDHPYEIRKILYENLVLPIVNTIHHKTDQEMRSLSEKMVHIIHQCYDQELSLEIIADQLHYNPNYLSGVFKKEFGSNFGDYVLNYRLTIAKKWLLETNMTIKDISERLQYNNSQNFIRFFKKKEGMTPGEYRKQAQ